MNPQSRFQRFLPALVLAFAATSLQAQNVELDIERSVKVEFNSQKGYSYNVYGTSDPAKKTGWKLLGGGDGTGESIVFFYRTETDQKVFFKVEAETSAGIEPPSTHEWNGTNLRLRSADGSWGDWVNLKGQKGSNGDKGDPGEKGEKGDKGDGGINIIDKILYAGEPVTEWSTIDLSEIIGRKSTFCFFEITKKSGEASFDIKMIQDGKEYPTPPWGFGLTGFYAFGVGAGTFTNAGKENSPLRINLISLSSEQGKIKWLTNINADEKCTIEIKLLGYM